MNFLPNFFVTTRILNQNNLGLSRPKYDQKTMKINTWYAASLKAPDSAYECHLELKIRLCLTLTNKRLRSLLDLINRWWWPYPQTSWMCHTTLPLSWGVLVSLLTTWKTSYRTPPASPVMSFPTMFLFRRFEKYKCKHVNKSLEMEFLFFWDQNNTFNMFFYN